MLKQKQEIKKELAHVQQVYIPAAEEGIPEIMLLQMMRLPIAFKDTPDQICGTAQRVGKVYDSRQALYRLKLRMHFAGRKTATLPGFFLLQEGVFVPYDSTNEELKQDGK